MVTEEDEAEVVDEESASVDVEDGMISAELEVDIGAVVGAVSVEVEEVGYLLVLADDVAPVTVGEGPASVKIELGVVSVEVADEEVSPVQVVDDEGASCVGATESRVI